MKTKTIVFLGFVGIFLVSASYFLSTKKINQETTISVQTNKPTISNPLSIKAMRERDYPGSEIIIDQKLTPKSKYEQFVTSYTSDGLKIYALLTIPKGNPPAGGWPVIIFNHGYIPPNIYSTTERYVAYVDYFAKNGYIVFKPDYRGHGNSEGEPEGAYYSPSYTIDNLNAIASIKKLPDANPDKIGVWGHSMGGNITLRDLVVNKDIKVAVIWGGVVGSYEDLMFNWRRRTSSTPSSGIVNRNRTRQNLIDQFGSPQENREFWNLIDPTYYVSDITAPVQLNVGANDQTVPPAFSDSLRIKLEKAGKIVEFHIYPGSDHNISQGFSLAMQRSLAFFDKYLKS